MIVVIETTLSNLGSILNMFKKVGVEAVASSNPEVITKADKLILPGVGAFDKGMQLLNQLGLTSALSDAVVKNKIPILGICLGMQLFAQKSEEGEFPGLGWIDGRVVRFRLPDGQGSLKIPHMGWNNVKNTADNPLFKGLPDNHRFYFLHSYHLVCNSYEDKVAYATYGYDFIAAVQHKNIFGVQFHPEKSHTFGMMILKNFAEMRC